MAVLLTDGFISDESGILTVDDHYEVIDGQIVETQRMGAKSGRIATAISSLLWVYVRTHKLGAVHDSQTGYRCFPNEPKRLRKPDVSFVRADRLPNGESPAGDFTIRPDLAVEVVSPNDLYDEIDQRVTDFVRVGTPLVWIVNPGTRSVLVRRPDDSCLVVPHEGTLSGEDVVPGFTCPVAELFT